MAVFPSIRPTGRNYSPGQFPSATYRGLSGATVKRVFGSKAYGHSIEFEFANVKDTTTKAILDHYYGQNGSIDRFTLPDEVVSGMEASLQALVKSPSSILWEYAEPPSVDSIFNGISTVTVRLIGELS